MGKRNYISEEEYYATEIAIYNDLPINTLRWVPESYKKPITENFKRFLLEGEKYTFLKDEGAEHIAVTNYARVFNAKTTRQLMVRFTGKNVIAFFNNVRVVSGEVFKEAGWEHNMVDLYDRYKDNDWRMLEAGKDLRERYLERV